MAEWRAVKCYIWDDDWFQALPDKAKLYWIFLLTNSHTEASGLYLREQSLDAAYLAATQRQIESFRQAFSSAGNAIFQGNWVLIPAYVKHQPNQNPNTWVSMLRQVEGAPPSLQARWIHANRSIAESFGNGFERVQEWFADHPPTETEIERAAAEQPQPGAASEVAPAPLPLEEIMALWNEVAAKAGLPQIQRLSDGRKAKLRQRWSEWGKDGADPMAFLRSVLAQVHKSAFLRGDNDRGWRFTFKFLVDNDSNALGIAEGNHEDTEGQQTDYGFE